MPVLPISRRTPNATVNIGMPSPLDPFAPKHSIREGFVRTARGGILYDSARMSQPSEKIFSPQYWARGNALEEMAGGRGSVCFVRAGAQRWVLRHYRRGGWMAHVSADRYAWLGANHTRAFAEWRLLAQLHEMGLPVPAPVAARYERTHLTYRADLMTVALPASRTLADAITAASLSQRRWRAVGGTIARFHAHGVHHADLNASNILIDAAQAVYVLDFDRGRIRTRGDWERQVLMRLRRSLEKVRRARAEVHFGDQEWQWLMHGYGE